MSSFVQGCIVEQTDNFGHRLKILRKIRGLSQSEFATLVGISQKVVSSYERDYRMPSVEKIPRIAEILDTSVDYLIGKNNNEKPSETDLKKPVLWKIVEMLDTLDSKEQREVLRYIERILAEKGR